jgi:hypothetical protein
VESLQLKAEGDSGGLKNPVPEARIGFPHFPYEEENTGGEKPYHHIGCDEGSDVVDHGRMPEMGTESTKITNYTR